MFYIVEEAHIGHVQLITEDPARFEQVVDLFLAEYAPDFGQVEGR